MVGNFNSKSAFFSGETRYELEAYGISPTTPSGKLFMVVLWRGEKKCIAMTAGVSREGEYSLGLETDGEPGKIGTALWKTKDIDELKKAVEERMNYSLDSQRSVLGRSFSMPANEFIGSKFADELRFRDFKTIKTLENGQFAYVKKDL